MNAACLASETASASSDSDEFENFLKSIKKPKVKNHYRLSTGSLSKFIVDTDDEEENASFEDMQMPLHSNRDLKTELKPLQEKDLNLCVPKDTSKVVPKHKTKLLSSPQQKKLLSLKDRSTTVTPSKILIKSVTTPIRRVVFSSDSEYEENVSLSSKGPSRSKKLVSKCHNTPKVALEFSDSEHEIDLEVPVKVPVFHLPLEESSDSDVPSLYDRVRKSAITTPLSMPSKNNKALNKKFNPVFSSDSTSSLDDFAPVINKTASFPTKSNSDTENFKGNSFCDYRTPINKRVPSRQVKTEKIDRIRTQCLVSGCFLSSLDSPVSSYTGKGFKRNRLELVNRLFMLFNDSVFERKLPKDMEVAWAKRLTKTAGVTKCTRVTKSETDATGKIVVWKTYQASISLSEKVIDCASRLRDTLIHEMCHAAVWLVNNANESHGPFWKRWARKANSVHPELPPIERCHNYDIDFKYIYRCIRCENQIGRHSKSLDTSKKVCGRCKGKLELQKNSSALNRPARSNPFATYVKNNYAQTKTRMKSDGGPSAHRDIMKSLSEQFRAASLS